MKVTKKLFFVALLLSLILSIGAAAAQDDITFEQSNIQDVSQETNNQNNILSDFNKDTAISPNNDEDDSSDRELGDSNMDVTVPDDGGDSGDVAVDDSHNKSSFSSLQEKINTANDGDTIFLDGMEYLGMGVEINVNKTLTIVGGSQSNPDSIATLDARKLSNIMRVTAGNVVITGIKFINAHADANDGERGGAIRWISDDGYLNNSLFENNHADITGGAIHVDGKNFRIEYCNFTNNDANQGGAIKFDGNNWSLNNSRFISNSAYVGGAIDANGKDAIVNNSYFENNHADGWVGAVRFVHNAILCNSHFVKNSAYESGAVRVGDYSIVKNCTFINNSANEYGTLNIAGNNCVVTNCTFEDNIAGDGGAVRWYGKNGVLSNSSFTNNSANYGGAFYSTNYGVNVTGNNFTGNSAKVAGDTMYLKAANNVITNNNIDNSNSDKYAIYFISQENVVEDNNFTNPENAIGYEEFFIEFDENYVGLAGKNISFPFYVFDSLGNPVNGEVSLQQYVKSSNGFIIIQNLGTQTLENGKASFNIKLPSSQEVMEMHASFNLPSKNIQRSFDIIVSNVPIASITQNNGSDDVVVKFVSDATGIVMFEVAGKNYFAEISNGDAIIDVTGLENGRYAVNFIYSGDENYQKEERIIIIEVNYAATTVIDVNESFKGYVGSSIEIPVYVHDSLGNPLSGYVTFYGYETRELVGGNAIFNISLPNAASALSLVLVYENDFKVIDVNVVEEPVAPKPTLAQNKDITVAYTGKAAYKVLLSKEGKPLTGENVSISFNGKNVYVRTDSKGYAILNLDTNLKQGTYTVKASYNGISVANKVKITQIIRASDKKIKKSAKTAKVKISLSNVDGKYLKSKTLKVKFNGKTYKVKTNKKGVAIWKVKKSMLKKLKVGKKVKYTITYGKDILTKKLIIKK